MRDVKTTLRTSVIVKIRTATHHNGNNGKHSKQKSATMKLTTILVMSKIMDIKCVRITSLVVQCHSRVRSNPDGFVALDSIVLAQTSCGVASAIL